jgi:hypothetical protein
MKNNNLNNKLEYNWIIGFTNAEGYFIINITKHETNMIKWQIRIKLNIKYKDLLLQIKSFFS